MKCNGRCSPVAGSPPAIARQSPPGIRCESPSMIHHRHCHSHFDARGGTARNDVNRANIRVGQRGLQNAIARGAAGAENGDGVQRAGWHLRERRDLAVVGLDHDDGKQVQHAKQGEGDDKGGFSLEAFQGPMVIEAPEAERPRSKIVGLAICSKRTVSPIFSKILLTSTIVHAWRHFMVT